MLGKGISGDSIIYTSMAYAYWKMGDVNVSSDFLNEMYKRRLMVTLKIYRCLNASYAGDDKSVLSFFWKHLAERGLISKSILKDMEQLKSSA